MRMVQPGRTIIVQATVTSRKNTRINGASPSHGVLLFHDPTGSDTPCTQIEQESGDGRIPLVSDQNEGEKKETRVVPT